MTYRLSFAVQLAISLPTTRSACRAVISQYAKTVSNSYTATDRPSDGADIDIRPSFAPRSLPGMLA